MSQLLELTSLIGPESYIKERLAVYRDAGITSLSINPVGGQDPVKTVEQLRELMDEI